MSTHKHYNLVYREAVKNWNERDPHSESLLATLHNVHITIVGTIEVDRSPLT